MLGRGAVLVFVTSWCCRLFVWVRRFGPVLRLLHSISLLNWFEARRVGLTLSCVRQLATRLVRGGGWAAVTGSLVRCLVSS